MPACPVPLTFLHIAKHSAQAGAFGARVGLGMSKQVKIAVIGAGVIGKCHVRSIGSVDNARLACVVDPSPDGQSYSEGCGVDWYASITDMFRFATIDGAILATPSQLHVDGALQCVANNCPVLVEKPLAIDPVEAEKLVNAARAAGVPVLTGHHRRHGAAIKKAKSLIENGVLGTVVTFEASCWFHKHDAYFDVPWRSAPGGGPIFINLIHDINTMVHLLGDVSSVQAQSSNKVRAGEVEDTAAVLLRFQSGVIGTLTVSDAVTSPWSWELTSGENPDYPETSQSCYRIGGTLGSLSIPDMTLWHHEGAQSWLNPIHSERIPIVREDPLIAQIRQFVAVIRGEEPPLVSGEDGLRTLRIVEAIKTSIATGQSVGPHGTNGG